MQEQWKKIPNFSAYEISAMGRVRRPLPSKFANNQCKGKDGIMAVKTTEKSYLFVHLTDDQGVRRVKKIHRLVAEAFVPNPLGLPEVNHIDNDKANCRASNLEWRSRLGNMRHAALAGRGRGVSFRKDLGKWQAYYSGKSLGFFITEEDALAARQTFVKELPHVE